MKWYRNMKISGKLIFIFLCIVILLGSMGFLGVLSWSSSNAQNQVLFDSYGNAQGYLGVILSQYQFQRALLRDMVLARDTQLAKELQEKIEGSDAVMMENLGLFADTCIDSESQALHDELKESLNAFREVRDDLAATAVAGEFDTVAQWLALDSVAHDARINTESAADGVAAASMDSTALGTDAVASATVTSGIATAVNNALAFMVDHAHTLMAEQDRTVTRSILLMTAGFVMAVLVAALLVWRTSRAIAKPLAGVTDAAIQLAAGNTAIQVTEHKTKDEVGRLTDAFRIMLRAIRALIDDVDMLAKAAVRGELSVRADASRHAGDYARIVEGINGTLSAIIGPIDEARAVLGELAQGNLHVVMKGDYQGDHAAIKEALNSTIATLSGYIEEISDVLGELAQGNLQSGIETDYHGDFAALKDSINGIVQSLGAMMTDINKAAEQVALGTQQVSGGSGEISQSATEQASSIEELTATMTQIADQTRRNAQGAGEAYKLSAAARNDARAGSVKMKEMQQAIDAINEAAASISKIIKVIDEIAFQTNILALNAAIEAARAGVHGKGFAVVAEEVRNLAARSASAAQETTQLIESSIAKTEAGTEIAHTAMTAFEGIVESVEKAVGLVEEITTSSKEQSNTIDQVSRGIEQMSAVVQMNTATAEETAAAAQELAGQAEILKNMVGQFRLRDTEDADDTPEIEAAEGQILLDDFGKY